MRASRRPPARLLTCLAALGLLAVVTGPQLAARAGTTGSAAAPEATVTMPTSIGRNAVTFTGHAPFNPGGAGIVLGDYTGACDPTQGDANNDQHFVRVVIPPGIDPHLDTLIRFQINWDILANPTVSDLALSVFGPDGKLVADSDGSQNLESVNVTSRSPGVYKVFVCAFQNTPVGTDFTGTVSAAVVAPTSFPAATGVTPPAFQQYEAPPGVALSAGEPSIGSNWKSGATLFTSGTDEYLVKLGPGTSSTWTLVNDDVTDTSNKISLDPIGFTDSTTGRTFVSQLLFVCSGAGYSDDDFTTLVTPSEGCGSGINGIDHQTFGAGPYPAPIPAPPTYPHAVYYCSQAPGFLLSGATCARSDDGGLTFGPPITAFDGSQCSGIHGHVRVGPEGTVYLPNSKCGPHQGVALSRDAGLTWTVTTVPDSLEGESDPSVSAGSDGTAYLGFSDGTGHPRISISTDKGATWSPSVDVGVPFGIKNSEFAEVIAGDGDRAAFAFLGTPTSGSDQATSFGKNAAGDTFVGGEWHMYVATTYDRGRTWTTVDATPRDPVQRGCIWNAGGSNPCRNLLDFNDITIDKTGHVLIGFADGCVSDALQPRGDASSGRENDCTGSLAVEHNGLVSHGAILRQVGGRGLFAAYDLPGSVRPVVVPPPSKPVTTPTKSGGHLAATGGLPLATGGVLLLALALVLHQRGRRQLRATAS